MRLSWWWTASIATAFGLVVAFVVPPRTRITPTKMLAGPVEVRGAFHVHTMRSDGSGIADTIASAASRAGLQFVILTDHGDGTRASDPPSYRHGVLVIDAVEISTVGGHYVALGLAASPYPLAGTPAVVVEDVRRLGGMGIVGHPDSPKPALAWRGWDEAFDGIEWLNADSAWRDESWGTLSRMLLSYSVRSRETLASLLDRPSEVLARWDRLSRDRPVPALAGADAHARIGGDPHPAPGGRSWQLPIPGYAASFGAFSNHVLIEAALSGDASRDAEALLASIARGRVYTVIDGLATPGGLTFSGAAGTRIAQMGDALPLDGPVTLHAEVVAPPQTDLTLLRDGVAVSTSRDAAIDFDATHLAGVYRIEAHTSGGPGRPPIPWIVSNPIRVGLAGPTPPTVMTPPPIAEAVVAMDQARAEVSSGSTSAIQLSPVQDPYEIRWRYQLAPGPPSGQFAAVQIPLDRGPADMTRVRLRARSEHPARIWLQVRAPGAADRRWGSTFYVDATDREVDVPLAALAPIGADAAANPPLGEVNALLLVVDTLNSPPGATGEITVSNVRLQR